LGSKDVDVKLAVKAMATIEWIARKIENFEALIEDIQSNYTLVRYHCIAGDGRAVAATARRVIEAPIVDSSLKTLKKP